MAITHSTVVRNAMADLVDDQVNAGTTDASGDFVVIDDAGPTDLISFTLGDPAFGASSGGVITLNGTPLAATADATGAANRFEVRNKDNANVYGGSVTGSGGGGDVEINDANVESGQSANLDSHSYEASP